MALFRVDFSGRGELSERQQKVRHHTALLAYWLTQFSAWAVLVEANKAFRRIQCLASSLKTLLSAHEISDRGSAN